MEQPPSQEENGGAGSGENSERPHIDPLGSNIEAVWAIYAREERSVQKTQRFLESISAMLERPLFFSAILLLAALWIAANLASGRIGWIPFDPPPFPWLQGLVSLCSLLTTIIVLVKQNRQLAKEERRDHLELQLNLLTEQKVTKLINLLEELRRDLPMIQDRHDAEATAMQVPTHPEKVLAALDERLDAKNPSKGPSTP
jgi:uncharacterized membrane protein